MSKSNAIVEPELSGVPESQAAQVEELQRILQLGKAATLTSADGSHEVQLPDPLYRLLLQIIADVADGRPVVYAAANQEFTTQQAADCLGVSRQFFVGLLEKGEIPFHRVGTHRRVTLRDLLNYRKQRDQRRHEALNKIAKESIDDATYDDF